MRETPFVDESGEGVEGRQVTAVVADEQRGGCTGGEFLDSGSFVDVEWGSQLHRLPARFETEAV